ncbi:BTAD domain-containing putative transcriptional regulator [Micromonospora chaiyaphumensis]|uniref:Predicted ATPase n=1 Tax=Micromonospora chaiyaphumensis TaxID=307119 RepID=A0A1C4VZ87_9ACTN|nr:BTAD domain-containing putative transcriptional regulator [Micromonospora chaiyaphumensis]SCE89258.1 Predicted ATPase [Micromonospora chaiyaphumensis]
MRFGVLGPLEVWTTNGRHVKIPEWKVRALLADLLAQSGRVVTADRLIDDLWGDRPPANPHAVLRSKISQLRRVLRDAEPGLPDPVVRSGAGYVLDVPADAVDAHRFEALLARAEHTGDRRQRVSVLAEALALWRGPSFVGFADAPFAAAAVARLEERRLTALEDQVELRAELGEDVTLVGELADLVADHPLRERFRATQMRVLYRLGRQGDALAAYRELRERLSGDLGLEPGPAVVALHQAILRQEESLAAPPAGPPVRRRLTNLPTPLTGLVGREGAVDDVRALLGAGRLVTLVGPGGVGKTRLAVEAAGGLTGDFPDGVWLVELAALDRTVAADPAEADRPALQGLVDRVAAELDVRAPTDARSCVEGLADALHGRRLLLVLDNCEHVVDDVAELVRRLLGGLPGLRVLTTSQEPLGVAGEQVWVVPPLALPEPEADHDPARLLRYGAVELFTVRARAGAAGFTLGPDNAADVAAVCRRLDGIPLALELAATRVRAMGVRQLAAGLDDRFGLLASGRRSEPARQQTLRAMIDWSWELLNGPERALLRRLAVHADGCTLTAAREVCGGGEVDPAQVPDLLARLIDRSLLVPAEQPDGPRYRLLESVAAYCLERLNEAGELADLRARHAEWYTALAEQADERLRGVHQRTALRQLDAEAANFRAALRACAHRRDAHLALRLTCALAWYWVLRSRVGEGRRALAAAVAVPGAAPEGLRGTAMTWQAGIAALAGEPPDALVEQRYATVKSYVDDPDDPAGRARAALLLAVVTPIDVTRPAEDPVNRLLATFRALGDRWGEAAALAVLAYHAQLCGNFSALRRDAERSLVLFRELGDHWGILQATTPLAELAQFTGEYDRAGRWFADGLHIAQELGLRAEVARQLNGAGRIAQLQGDHVRARELFRRARTLAAEESVKAMEQVADLGLAVSDRWEGDLDAAERRLLPWLSWNRRAAWPAGIAAVQAELGFVAEQRGDAHTASARHREGWEAARQTRERRTIALALEGLAGAWAVAGDGVGAARLLGAAAAAREAVGMPLPPAERGDVERIAARARAVLGEDGFKGEFEYGAGLRPEECVARTLAEETGTAPPGGR